MIDTVTIPAGLPLLQRGVGVSPEHGGCLVQLASRLRDGRSWTDEPAWLHPVLAGAAIRVNDDVPDGYRPVLAPLAADLAGLSACRARRVTVGLAVWAARRVLWCDARVAAPERVRADLAVALDAAAAMDHRAGEWSMQARKRAGGSGYAEWAAVHACHAVTAALESSSRAGSCAAEAVAEDAKLRYPGGSKRARVARYEAQREFLVALIDQYRELTKATSADTRRWQAACELIGVTS